MSSKLVSMKLDPEKRDKGYGPTAVTETSNRPIYPWGLAINLDEEALDKLGIELPKVGSEMTLIARVDVTAVSSNESESGKSRSASLQITEMCLESGGGDAGKAAAKLYDRKG